MIDFDFLIAMMQDSPFLKPDSGTEEAAKQVIQQGRDGNAWSGAFGYNWSEILTAILGAAGTLWASFWGWRTLIQKGKQDRQVSEGQVFDILIKENERLALEYKQIVTHCNKMQSELLLLQNEVFVMRQKVEFFEKNNLASDAREMLSKVMDAADRPMWIHNVGNDIKYYLNDAYCKLYGIKRPNFWTPVNILARYPAEVCLEYMRLDLLVIKSNMTQIFDEVTKLDILNPNSEEEIKIKVKKTPLTINENTYILGEVISHQEFK